MGQTPEKADIEESRRFSYQGNLAEEGQPANGVYDFQIKLFDAETGGTLVGEQNIIDDLTVHNGIFSVVLDFGDVFDGSRRWIEVGVRAGSDVGAYTVLVPRQEIHPVPYALFAESAIEVWEYNQLMTDSSTGEISFANPYWFSSQVPYSPIINLIKAPTVAKQIENISVIVPYRTGEYTSTFTLTFDIYNYDGLFLRSVSRTPIDLKSVQTKRFVTVDLSEVADNLIVAPGEYLGISVRRGGEPAGDLDMRFAAEVLVRNALQRPDVSK